MQSPIKKISTLILASTFCLGASANKAMLDEGRPFGGTSIRYISSSALGMHPTAPSYSYSSNPFTGCRNSSSGLLEMVENLDVPDGSRLISVSVMGKDNDNGWLGYTLRVDGQDIDNQASVGASGNSLINIGAFIDFQMPYFSYQQQKVTMTLSQLGSDIDLCGYRIGYLPPDVADDVIFVNNFYR